MTLWQFFDRLAPPSCAASPDEVRRGRLFVVTVLVLTAASMLFAILSYQSVGRVNAVVVLLIVGALLAAANVLLGHLVNRLRPVATLICVEHVVVVSALGWSGGGPADTSQWWLAPAPVVAAFLLGPRAGVVSMVAVTVSKVAAYAAWRAGFPFDPISVDHNFFATAAPVTVFMALAGLAWVYEQSRLGSLALVDDTMARLQAANDELARLAHAITTARDQAVAESKRKSVFIDDMRGFSQSHAGALERGRKSTERVSTAIKSIATSVETLARASSTSDEAIDTVAAAAAAMHQTATAMVGAVDETDAPLRALRGAVDSVQTSVAPLNEQASATAGAMAVMERSAASVEGDAQRTAALSAAVIHDAVRGAEAARRAGDGIGQIKESATTVSAAMRDLVLQLDEIDRILAVIDDVSVETNVLALNASILAAQAGEHGRGFGVVAEQIKALAARTASNTKRSAEVVDQVKARAHLADRTLSQAVVAVDAGLGLSEDASSALDQIVRSASEAEAMARGIESKTKEQVKRAQEVVAAMSRVMREVERATGAVSDHSRTAGLIESSMRRIKNLAPELARRAESQTASSRAVRTAIAEVNEMAQRLAAVQGEQTRAAEEAAAASDALAKAQRGALQAIEALTFEKANGR
jgi:methyl-accepting chemotaxis protein